MGCYTAAGRALSGRPGRSCNVGSTAAGWSRQLAENNAVVVAAAVVVCDKLAAVVDIIVVAVTAV
jgi:hypothetical protein